MQTLVGCIDRLFNVDISWALNQVKYVSTYINLSFILSQFAGAFLSSRDLAQSFRNYPVLSYFQFKKIYVYKLWNWVAYILGSKESFSVWTLVESESFQCFEGYHIWQLFDINDKKKPSVMCSWMIEYMKVKFVVLLF